MFGDPIGVAEPQRGQTARRDRIERAAERVKFRPFRGSSLTLLLLTTWPTEASWVSSTGVLLVTSTVSVTWPGLIVKFTTTAEPTLTVMFFCSVVWNP